MKVLYSTEATSTGAGRDGHARSADGTLDLEMRAPKEMGGSGEGSNPEQLFATGYAACFHSAMQHVAREKKLDASGSAVTARVGIGPLEDRPGFGLEVALRVDLPSMPADQASALVEAAHQVCPYSNATRGNIEVTLEVGETA